jgi:hypothetical protein
MPAFAGSYVGKSFRMPAGNSAGEYVNFYVRADAQRSIVDDLLRQPGVVPVG